MKNDIIAGALFSIKPEWCKLIVNGQKTIEVRKNRPKIPTPFKGFIYCTKDDIDNHPKRIWWRKDNTGFEHIMNGKVIGEFVCDKIDKIVHGGTSNKNIQLCILDDNWLHRPLLNEYLYQTGLIYAELDKYSNDGNLYGLHISDLKIYDEPKELSEFGLTRAPQSWRYVEMR